MAQSSASDTTLIKSENEAPDSAMWSEEHDCIPLKQRLKLLLASKRLSESADTKSGKEITPIDIVVKKEDESSDSQVVHSACLGEGWIEGLSSGQGDAGELGDCNSRESEINNCICPNQITLPETNDGVIRVENINTADNLSLQRSMLPKFPVKVKVECTHNSECSLESCINGSFGTIAPAVKIKTEIPDDFWEDLDHIVLKERQRMLLSRKSSELTKSVLEENYPGLSSPVVDDMIQHGAEMGTEESHSSDTESSVAGNNSCDITKGNASVSCKILGSGSLDDIIAASSCTTARHQSLACHSWGTESTSLETESTKSRNSMSIPDKDRICSSKKTSIKYKSCGKQDSLSGNHNSMISSALSISADVKVEPLDNDELHSPVKNAVGNFSFDNIFPAKSELKIHDESCGDEIDHMLLRERMKLLASKEVPNVDICGNFEYPSKFVTSVLNCSPVTLESTKPPRINRPRKRRKTATDSVETALEEDAPGLLQVLIDKGVSLNEIKLYGETESDEALDESFTEESFTELEAVISKLFSHRHSLLKFAPIRCIKGEKTSYCLACLISLVEQARYLQFRKWPVEWGWCRDLQSFIFVFERHNRIVLERPEYGYATYFFELVDSLPIDWQVKRLVTAMKLSSCSRVTLIENRALMVGEDLTEGEAQVLMEYGWIPNSGLGTMLKYCDRVVHDRKHEKDSSEWRSKIGKLLMDGYNGGTIVSTDVPKKVMEYGSVQSPQIKLEL